MDVNEVRHVCFLTLRNVELINVNTFELLDKYGKKHGVKWSNNGIELFNAFITFFRMNNQLYIDTQNWIHSYECGKMIELLNNIIHCSMTGFPVRGAVNNHIDYVNNLFHKPRRVLYTRVLEVMEKCI